MRKIIQVLIIFLLFSLSLKSQNFWSENFNATNCLVGCAGSGYTSVNGTWSQTILGTESSTPNRWFVSCKENNNGLGNCSNACVTSGNQTMHVSTDPSVLACPNDCGALYDPSILAITDRRIESPTINCTGHYTITVSFVYFYEGNSPNDIAVLWYFNGTTWAQVAGLVQSTNTSCTTGHGVWMNASFALPASADNNPNVKIGIEWKNNSQGVNLATSMAFDDVVLQATLPTVNPTFNLTAPACVGSSITGTYTGTTVATSYQWAVMPSAGVTIGSPVSASTTISFNTPGTYSVSLTASATGSVNGTVTNTVLVSAQPTLAVSSTSTSICAGSSVTLTASGANTYTWTPSQGPALPSTATVVVTPTTTTTYSVLGGSGGGCTDSDAITVTVLPIATAVTPSVSTICPSGAGIVLTASGASTYSWTPANGLSATTGATVIANPTLSTTYSITGTNGACSTIATATVNVYVPAPVMISAANNPVCQTGPGTVLTAFGATTYTWAPATGLSATNGTTVTANPATTTTYTVTGTTSNGCLTLPGTLTLSVTPVFTASINSATTTICSGSTTTLTILPAGPGYTYTWSPGASIIGPVNTASVVVSPTLNTVYSVSVAMGGCTAQAFQMITVLSCSPPVASFTTVTNDSICVGGCITFSNTSSGIVDSSYWYFPGGSPSFVNTPAATVQVCYASPGTYSVALVAFNVYGSDSIFVQAASVADTVTAVALQDTTIRVGQSAPLTASGGLSYLWSPGTGLACPTCSATSASPTVTTTYTVQVSNSPYCFAYDTVRVQVDFICGELFVANAFSPNGDGRNDVLHVRGFCLGTFVFRIYNRWGEKVFESQNKDDGWDGTFHGEPMEPGVFVYSLEGMSIDNKPVSKKGNITLIR